MAAHLNESHFPLFEVFLNPLFPLLRSFISILPHFLSHPFLFVLTGAAGVGPTELLC